MTRAQCCRTAATGMTECFSQGGSGGGGSVDGGPATGGSAVPPLDASPPIACGGTGGACSCSATVGSATYGFNCAAGATSCTCTINGGPGKVVVVSTGTTDACADPASTFAACGFPEPK